MPWRNLSSNGSFRPRGREGVAQRRQRIRPLPRPWGQASAWARRLRIRGSSPAAKRATTMRAGDAPGDSSMKGLPGGKSIHHERCIGDGSGQGPGRILASRDGDDAVGANRPWVGLNPTMPFTWAGQMIDPLVSVPRAKGASPAATAAPNRSLNRKGTGRARGDCAPARPRKTSRLPNH